MSNYVTYKGEAYIMTNPPVSNGSMGALKESCPNTQITIKAGSRTKIVSLGEVRLDGE